MPSTFIYPAPNLFYPLWISGSIRPLSQPSLSDVRGRVLSFAYINIKDHFGSIERLWGQVLILGENGTDLFF
jgi:hypothetical protein